MKGKVNPILLRHLLIVELAKLYRKYLDINLSERPVENEIEFRVVNDLFPKVDYLLLTKEILYLESHKFIKVIENEKKQAIRITLRSKIISADLDQRFKDEYDAKWRANWQFWVQLISGIVVGVTAIIALFMSAGTCNKGDKSKQQSAQVNTIRTSCDTISHATHHVGSPPIQTKAVNESKTIITTTKKDSLSKPPPSRQ